jgi:hypothetical protein
MHAFCFSDDVVFFFFFWVVVVDHWGLKDGAALVGDQIPDGILEKE